MAQLDTAKYGVIVRNDVSFAGGHVDQGMIVGGNLTSSGNLQLGDQLAGVSPALVVEKDVNTSQQIALFNRSYYFNNPVDRAGGADHTNFQNPGTSLTSDPLSGGLSALFASFTAISQSFLTQADTAGLSYQFLNQGNKLSITAVTGVTNYLTLTAASLNTFFGDSNREIEYNNISDGATRLVINYVGNSPSDALTFNAKTLGLSTSTYDQVVWNFVNVSTLTLSQSADTYHGAILAPLSQVNWNANNLDGQLIASQLTASQSREYHDYAYFTGSLAPIPESSTIGITAVSALAVMAARRILPLRRTV